MNYINRWQNLNFDVLWKDEIVASVIVVDSVVLITRNTHHPVKQIFSKDQMDIFELSCILESRCWDRNRANIDQILDKLNLQFFDPLAIVMQTHGVSYNDFLWFRFNGEILKWKDVAPQSRTQTPTAPEKE